MCLDCVIHFQNGLSDNLCDLAPRFTTILGPDYHPTNEDVLLAHIRSSAAMECAFDDPSRGRVNVGVMNRLICVSFFG